MSRSSTGWILIIVLLGIILGIVGGGIMGGVVGMYIARTTTVPVTVPIPQEIKAVTSSQPPVVQNLTVNSTSEIINAVSKVEPAVVTVVTNLSLSNGFGDNAQASGSGVIISQDGYVITNNHVVEGANTVDVIYTNGDRVSASIVGTDLVTDIAVLKVNGQVPAFVSFGDSNALQLGEWVIAIGSPLGNYRGSVTVGVVSGMNRKVASQEGLIQTDAAINHGNSGGPLINLEGQIVGINTLVVRDSVGGAPAEGLGFAVPSATVRSVAQQLISRGSIQYPFIGISYTEVTPQLAGEMKLTTRHGVLVTQITRGSPAETAGIQAQDVVTAIDNHQIDENNTLRSILFQYKVGDPVTLTIERGGQTIQVKLTLVARPS
ncbi:MAG TPA: trypsin-like peptidase domain-containing protein [Anaerolineae bacterium]|nr:trypsin-like peptidase domain-containing protein [Anaerolineae bacterium]